MADIIDIARRSVALGTRSKAASGQRRQRDRQLLGLLEAVERHLVREREEIAALRSLYDDLETAQHLIRSGKLLAAVEDAAGPLAS